MSNDINRINAGQSQQSDNRQVEVPQRDRTENHAQPSDNTESVDKVSLPDMASRLKSLEQKLTSQPEVDQSHVRRIRDALLRGEYRIDPEKVADKMIQSEKDS